jgi:AraC-like DNA-binding protein
MKHTKLLEAGTIRVTDWRCPGGHRPWTGDEASVGFEISFPRRGVFVRAVRGRESVCDPTCVLFFNRTEPYRVRHPVHGGDECTVLSVSPELLREAAAAAAPRLAAQDARFPVDQVGATADVELLHRRLYHGTSGGTLSPEEAEELALALVERVMARVVERCGTETSRIPLATRRRHREMVVAALELLAARCTDAISLSDVADRIGCSPFHFARIFRREVGTTVVRHRNTLRLRAGLAAVMDGAPNLTGLALDLGFSDHAHFTREFRREYGTTPSHVRDRRTAGTVRAVRPRRLPP